MTTMFGGRSPGGAAGDAGPACQVTVCGRCDRVAPAVEPARHVQREPVEREVEGERQHEHARADGLRQGSQSSHAAISVTPVREASAAVALKMQYNLHADRETDPAPARAGWHCGRLSRYQRGRPIPPRCVPSIASMSNAKPTCVVCAAPLGRRLRRRARSADRRAVRRAALPRVRARRDRRRSPTTWAASTARSTTASGTASRRATAAGGACGCCAGTFARPDGCSTSAAARATSSPRRRARAGAPAASSAASGSPTPPRAASTCAARSTSCAAWAPST